MEFISQIKDFFARGFLTKRRFAPFAWLTLLLAFSNVAGLTELLPEQVPKPLVLAILSAVAVALFFDAYWGWPHEKRRMARTQNLIDACKYGEAEEALGNKAWLTSFPAEIERLRLLSSINLRKGDLICALSHLQAAESHALTLREECKLKLLRARIMQVAGNRLAVRKEVTALAEIPIHCFDDAFDRSMLQSTIWEWDGQYREAKTVFDELLLAPQSVEPRLKAIAYNNLARLEGITNNRTSTRSYYERAWQELKIAPVAHLFPIVGHNLLMDFAISREREKADQIVKDYQQMLAEGALEQGLEFLSDKLHLARAFGDRPLLLDCYDQVSLLYPKLDKSQQCSVTTSQLRMRLNDGLPFQKQLLELIDTLKCDKDLPLELRFRALSEIDVVLRSIPAPESALQIEASVIEDALSQFLALEDEISAKLQEIHPALPGVRDIWHQRKLQILKLKISRSAPNPPPHLFDMLFDSQHERRAIWADKGNPREEILALTVICDEYLAYCQGLPIQIAPEFARKYRARAT